MSAAPGENIERRLLILAPVGRDAELMAAMLAKEGVACAICVDPEELALELERGAAAVVVAEEALAADDERFAALIERQPPWSDLPVIVLTHRGADSSASQHAVGTLGNVTLIERPVRISAFLSATRSALRARQRQYQTRAHLAERELADRRKDEFLATLAHELRNPLAPIRNAVQLLRVSPAGRDSEGVLGVMDRQVDHMVRLVDDLMEVSRITRGSIELRREAVDISAVISAAVETCRPLLDAARHELTVEMPSQPLIVEADPVRLGQVFSNLLNNAVKYTDPGGRIRVVVRREGAHALASVADTGIGLEAEAIPRVFDMFVQAHSRAGRPQAGLGIGLTLVKSLTEMHGGSVTASSPGPGRGSEFAVMLPLAVGAAAQHPQDDGATIRKVGGLPHVLVVDDNKDAADSLAAVLRIMGAEVRVNYDGPAALAELDAFHPVAAFLDLGLPGMDGCEIARHIRERPGGRGVRLVALTGWGQERDRRRSEEAGFDLHLVKPAPMESLRTILSSLRAGT